MNGKGYNGLKGWLCRMRRTKRTAAPERLYEEAVKTSNTIENRYLPSYTVPPGEILEEELTKSRYVSGRAIRANWSDKEDH